MQGPIGPQGPAGVSGYEIVVNTVTPTLGRNGQTTVSSACPAGKSAIGGGFEVSNQNFAVLASVPETSPQPQWSVLVRNSAFNTQTGAVTVRAICASAP